MPSITTAPPPPQTPYAPPAPTGGGSAALRVSEEELEMMELKVKIICQEKYILALKMELKAAELQVNTNAQVTRVLSACSQGLLHAI